jgi:hypothetical protein
VAFWKFDDCGAVVKYDAWIPNLQSWVLNTTGGVSTTNANYQMQTIQQICLVSQTRCTGANQQWASFGECVAGLQQKPYGNYDEAWGDNIVCRSIHLLLTQIRPDVSASGFSAPAEKSLHHPIPTTPPARLATGADLRCLGSLLPRRPDGRRQVHGRALSGELLLRRRAVQRAARLAV